MIGRDGLGEYLRGSLGALPLVCVAGALVLGGALSLVDVGPSSPIGFQGTADDARNLLIGITSTMVTVIALLLGLTVVALQMSSSQFSPRLLRNFLRDRPNQIVLGAFVGTFAYSAAGLFTVGVAGGERSTDFPRLAVSVAVVLLFVDLALLVFFADHLAHSVQVDAIMRTVERAALRVIAAQGVDGPEAAPAVPARARVVLAGRSGYVQAVNQDRLLAVARAHGLSVRLRPMVGDHVVAGSVLAWVWWAAPEDAPSEDPPSAAAAVSDLVRREVRLGFERTYEQDVGMGFRQLVDIGCKAASPAVNDPYTAVQSIDHLTVLFTALAAARPGDHVLTDGAGGSTVAVPARSFVEHLALGVGLMRRYGAREPTIAQALLRLLASCAAAGRPEYGPAVEHEATLVLADAERETGQPADLALVRAAAESVRAAVAAGRSVAEQDRMPT